MLGEAERCNLETLLNIWGKAWAREKGSTFKWVTYTDKGLTDKLPERNCHHKSQMLDSRYHLTVLAEGEERIQIEDTSIGEEAISVYKEKYLKNEGIGEATLEITEMDHWTKGSRLESETSFQLDVGGEIAGGVGLIAQAKFSMNTAFGKKNTKERTDTQGHEDTGKATYRCPPGTETTLIAYSRDRHVASKVTCPVNISGYVVIQCKSKVRHEGANNRRGRHRKWAIHIRDVVADITRYKDSQDDELIPADERAVLCQVLTGPDALRLEQPEQTKVYYNLIQDGSTVRCQKGGYEIVSKQLPGFAQQHAVSAASGSSGRTVSIRRRMATANAEDADAYNITDKVNQVLEKQRDEAIERFAQRVQGNIEYIADGADANAKGSRAFVGSADDILKIRQAKAQEINAGTSGTSGEASSSTSQGRSLPPPSNILFEPAERGGGSQDLDPIDVAVDDAQDERADPSIPVAIAEKKNQR